jgi:hypothetical protein
MTKRVLLFVVALLALAGRSAAGPSDPSDLLGLVRFDSGIKAPDFSLPGLNGERVGLSSSNGLASLVVFWATW